MLLGGYVGWGPLVEWEPYGTLPNLIPKCIFVGGDDFTFVFEWRRCIPCSHVVCTHIFCRHLPVIAYGPSTHFEHTEMPAVVGIMQEAYPRSSAHS